MNEEKKIPDNIIDSRDNITEPNVSTNNTSSVPHVTEKPQKALRTYESDVADVLAHKKISTTTIALAEKKKKTGENSIGGSIEQSNEQTDKSQSIKKMVFALISLILICAGFIGAYYFYRLSPLADISSPKPQVQAPISIIPTDSQVVISIDNLNPKEIISDVRLEMDKPQDNDTVKEIIFIQNKNGQNIRVTGPTILQIMGIPVPNILARSIANDWMLGVYDDNQGVKRVFVIATIDYFQNAFAGMLQWESTMADDLKQYLYVNTPSDIAPNLTNQITNTEMLSSSTLLSLSSSTNNTGSSTKTQNNTASSSLKIIGTSTLETSTSTNVNATTSTTTVNTSFNSGYVVLHGSFSDRIIQNKDVREFSTKEGVLFLYSFIDSTKLVLSGSESTLSAILDRLEKKTTIR